MRAGGLKILALVVASALGAVQPVMGQGAPQEPTGEVLTATNLTDPQKAQMKAYVEFWAKRLISPDAKLDETKAARTALVRPLTGAVQGVSLPFRTQYSADLMVALQPAFTSENPHAVVNGYRVIAVTGTAAAMDLLMTRADIQTEKRLQVRLAAAQQLRILVANLMRLNNGITTANSSGLHPQTRITTLARTLRDAARRETDALVLWHHLQAVVAADNDRLDVPVRVQVRNYLVEAMSGVVTRIAADKQGGSAELLNPVYAAIVALRDRAARISSAAEWRDFGPTLGRFLGQMLTLVRDDWNGASADATRSNFYADVVGTSEGFLGLVDKNVRANPSTPTPAVTTVKLRDAWENRDQKKFEDGVNAWVSTVQKPPYTPAGQ